jgi:hypothetical protein
MGQSVTLTATVSSSGPATTTGTVTFRNGATNLATVTLIGGVASLTRTKIQAGTLSVTAVYHGDAMSATITSGVLPQVVTPAVTTTVIASSLNPSMQGQSVTFTAVVVSPTTAPTGTVTFTAGASVLGVATLNGTGRARVTTATLPVGSNTVTATYSGSANVSGSSGALVQIVK